MKPDYNTNASTIAIPLSKTKLILLLLGSITFVVLGLWVTLKTSLPETSDTWQRWKGLIIGILCILFFGGCALVFLFQLFNNNPGLIIDDKGITINPGIFSSKFIPWDDIQKFGVQRVVQTKLIGIYIKNPEQYIQQQKGTWIKRMLKLNYKSFGALMSIPTNNLKGDFDSIYSLLNNRLTEYNHKVNNFTAQL